MTLGGGPLVKAGVPPEAALAVTTALAAASAVSAFVTRDSIPSDNAVWRDLLPVTGAALQGGP